MKKQQFRVEDMHCVNCALRLQELEDTLPEVKICSCLLPNRKNGRGV